MGGKRSAQPYCVDDFDVIVVYFPESHKLRHRCVYVVPASELEARGFLQSACGSKGKYSMSVYLPGTPVFQRGPRRNDWANGFILDLGGRTTADVSSWQRLRKIL